MVLPSDHDQRDVIILRLVLPHGHETVDYFFWRTRRGFIETLQNPWKIQGLTLKR